MIIPFAKKHGIGNDFILVDGSNLKNGMNMPHFAASICHRRFGVGADGLMVHRQSLSADARMDYYNSDGSVGEMCGNGIRCFARFVDKHNSEERKSLSVETMAGTKYLTIQKVGKSQSLVGVMMGQPVVHVLNEEIEINQETYLYSYLSMGVPHVIIFLDKPDDSLTDSIGPLIETHERFPQGTNVNFCHMVAPQTMKVFTWERGAGHTLACGTGITCAFAMAVQQHKASRQMTVQAEGGMLDMTMDGNNDITMTGLAQDICHGYYLYEID